MTQKEWHAEVAKQFVLQGTNAKKLAEEIEYSYYHVLAVICGTNRSKPTVDAISERLGIEPYTE